jgi:curli biogenesis system outer membrane secretion channel CsgG
MIPSEYHCKKCLDSNFIMLIIGLWGCETMTTPKAKVTSGGGPSIAEAQMEPYNGPKARIAVSRFTDKTGKGWWTGQIGDGMADMLTTALFNTNRFIVLERQTLQDVLAEQDLGASGRIRQDTAAPYNAFSPPKTIYVTANTVNVRADAGTNFIVVGKVKKGDTITALGKKGSWFHVRLGSGQEGYIYQALVTLQ